MIDIRARVLTRKRHVVAGMSPQPSTCGALARVDPVPTMVQAPPLPSPDRPHQRLTPVTRVLRGTAIRAPPSEVLGRSIIIRYR
jgi:hypothetical protein